MFTRNVEVDMKEELIKFETAKLAKEKGFDEKSVYWFNNSGELINLFGMFTYNSNNGNRSDFQCTSPTQSLLQKWLREVHNLHITVWNWEGTVLNYNGNYTPVINYCLMGCVDEQLKPNKLCKTYEEALELGLFEGLKLI